MKKSRIAKLALMGASITALAATLTTSTYAWYVSNKTATVKGGLGATNSAAADGSILLSWDNTATTYYKSISFSDTNSPSYSSPSNTSGSYAASNPLDPVQWDATNSKFVTLTSDATSTQYIAFNLWIKSDAQVTVTPTIAITNTTNSYTDQIAYTDTGLPTDKSKGQAFHVDALEAIYTQQKLTYASAINYVDVDDYNATNSASLTAEQYAALTAEQKVKVAAGTTYSYVQASTTGTGGNAHDYYNSVVAGTTTPELTAAQKQNVNATGLGQIVVPAGTPLQLFYVIYLNGADTDCFNSCAGQTISFEMSFKVNA